MTPRQFDALTFVREFWATKGHSPSYDEIREGLGLKSKSGIWVLLNALEDQGYIARTFNQHRSVTPVEISPANPKVAKIDRNKPGPKPKVVVEAGKKKVKLPWD